VLCGAYVTVRYCISRSVVFTDFAKSCGSPGRGPSVLAVRRSLVRCHTLLGWHCCWVQLFGRLATSALHCVCQAAAWSCCCSAQVVWGVCVHDCVRPGLPHAIPWHLDCKDHIISGVSAIAVILTLQGCLPDQTQVAKISKWGPCQDLSDVHTFLGTLGMCYVFLSHTVPTLWTTIGTVIFTTS
jgi:hypothetical protein